MDPFALIAHVVDKHGFNQADADDVDAARLREQHARDHVEGGYYTTLHHTHADVS